MGDDSRTVKAADESAAASEARTMHGTSHEWNLMSGRGSLIKQDASRVPVSGEKPDTGRTDSRRP